MKWLWNYIWNNRQWLFSGIGVTAILSVFGWLWRRRYGPFKTQFQKSGAGSTNGQVGGDLNIRAHGQTLNLGTLTGTCDTSPSTTAQIAERMRAVRAHVEEWGVWLEPRANVAAIAELLEYDSPRPLELLLSGERPLPFSEGTRFCKQFGLSREWLYTGSGEPFYQSPRYYDPDDLLTAFLRGRLLGSETGKPYDKFVFVLSNAEHARAAVYGQLDRSGYRFDLLLRDVPIADYEGAEKYIFPFALTAAAISGSTWGEIFGCRRLSEFPYIPHKGRVLSVEENEQLLWGRVHPAVVLLDSSHQNYWVDDLWKLGTVNHISIIDYTMEYQGARRRFLKVAHGMGITSERDLFEFIERRMAEDPFIKVVSKQPNDTLQTVPEARFSSLHTMSIPENARIVRIVVASPGDVQAERDIVPVVVDEVNRQVADERNLVLKVTRWEKDAFPGFHTGGPQALIDSVLRISDCDVFVGICWKRFGTPVRDAKSGTEHEYKQAYEAWKQKGTPHIFFYFNEKSYTPKEKEETDQWGLVLEFKKNFPKEGLWWSYKSTKEFERLFRNHLTNFIRDKFRIK